MSERAIVLVEDDYDDRELTLRALKRCRPQTPVLALEDGVAALAYLKESVELRPSSLRKLPALVLLDLKMPKIDGLELLKRLRAEEALRPIPMVVLTSSGERRDISAAYQLGANSYITKPVEFEKFLKIVDCLCTYWLDYNETGPPRT